MIGGISMSYRDEFISKANNYLNQDVHMNCNRFYMGIQNNYQEEVRFILMMLTGVQHSFVGLQVK